MQPNKYRVWDKFNNKFFEPVYEAYKGKLSEVILTPSGVVVERTLDGFSMIDHQAGRWVVQFFTGLKDKNGVEIYEGDVLESDVYLSLPDGGKRMRFAIVFVAGGFYLYDITHDDSGDGFDLNYGIKEYDDRSFDDAFGYLKKMVLIESEYPCKVIGNIYEHPNLLTDAA